MSEWNMGISSGAGTNARNSLTAALMLRLGGRTESAADAAAPRTERDMPFADVLGERATARGNAGSSRASDNRAAMKDIPETKTVSADDGVSRDASRQLRRMETKKAETDSVGMEKATQAVAGDAVQDDRMETAAMTGETETTAPAEQEALDTAGSSDEQTVTAETLAQVLAEMLAILQTLVDAAAGNTATETEGLPVSDTATEAVSPAEMLETLRSLLTQASGGTDATGMESILTQPDAFLDKLQQLLASVGLTGEDLQTAMQSTGEGLDDALAARLLQAGEGLRVLLAEAAQTTSNEEGASSVSGELPAIGETSTETTDTGAESGDTASEERGHKPAPPAFAAAFGEQTLHGQDVAALARGQGVHAVASQEGAFGQQVSAIAQEKVAAPMPETPMTAQTARSVAEQVLTRLQTVNGEEKHEMELQLKPESLGKIQLRIVEERGQVLAKFTAESEKVRAVLESNMQLLKDALEKNGLTVQSLSVSVGQRQQEGAETASGGNGMGNAFGRRSDSIGTSGTTGVESGLELRVRMSARVREYLYGPDSTISLKA